MDRNSMPEKTIQTSSYERPATVAAFTLVELLVVIVIIAILIGILLPVVGKIRTSAHIANTQASIATLVAGIEAYHQTFNAYPAQLVGPGGGATLPQVASFDLSNGEAPPAFSVSPSPSEWLFLWMMGGVNVPVDSSGAATGFEYSQRYIGAGPVSLNPLQNYRHYKPFIGTTLKASDGKAPLSPDPLYAGKNFQDTSAPEFLDDFSPPMPILYLRANAGATNVVYSDGGTNSAVAGTAQYDLGSVSSQIGPQYYYGVPQNPSAFSNDWNNYFGDPNAKNPSAPPAYLQPRQKDRYILISAGPDGIYGTTDDITNFGTPGQ